MKLRYGLAALVLILVGVVAFGRIADRFMLWPSRDPIDARGAVRQMLPDAHGTVEVWIKKSRLAETQDPTAFILRFYGNADRPERWIRDEADHFANHAVEVWGVNYPGFGASEGDASLAGVARSARVAFDAMKARAGAKPIYVFGTSMGTTAALHVAAEHPTAVAGVFLHNPPALAQLVRGEFGWWNLWLIAWPVSLQVPRELDSVSNAARAQAPAIFVMSTEDEVVRHKYHRLVADAYAGEKHLVVMEGAQHNSPIDATSRQKIDQIIEGWLAR